MVKLNKEGCSFFSKKVTFLDNGVSVTQYTDNVSEYETLINKFSHLSNLVVSDVVPTPEQEARLVVLNGLDLSLVDHWGAEVLEFVKSGYIDPTSSSILSTIADQYLAESKIYVVSNMASKIAEVRYNKEISGVDFNGLTVKTDRESQSTITSSLLSFTAGILTSINFKFVNGWQELDAAGFSALAMTVAGHVNKCFTAEKAVLAKLNDLQLEDLIAKTPDGKQVVDIDSMFTSEYSIL